MISCLFAWKLETWKTVENRIYTILQALFFLIRGLLYFMLLQIQRLFGGMIWTHVSDGLKPCKDDSLACSIPWSIKGQQRRHPRQSNLAMGKIPCKWMGSWESHCERRHFIGKSSKEMGSFPLPYLITSYHQMNSHKQIHAGWKRKNSASNYGTLSFSTILVRFCIFCKRFSLHILPCDESCSRFWCRFCPKNALQIQ